MIVDQGNNTYAIMVLDGVLPLAIQTKNQMEFSNKKNKDLDEDDLDENIEKVVVEGNLSPKQIDTIKATNGKQTNKGKISNTNTMQTRSHTS